MFYGIYARRYSNVYVQLMSTSVFFLASLKYINVAMVTILKNVTNILTALGELYMFRKHQNQKVWTAMFLMVNDMHLLFSVTNLANIVSWHINDYFCYGCMQKRIYLFLLNLETAILDVTSEWFF